MEGSKSRGSWWMLYVSVENGRSSRVAPGKHIFSLPSPGRGLYIYIYQKFHSCPLFPHPDRCIYIDFFSSADPEVDRDDPASPTVKKSYEKRMTMGSEATAKESSVLKIPFIPIHTHMVYISPFLIFRTLNPTQKKSDQGTTKKWAGSSLLRDLMAILHREFSNGCPAKSVKTFFCAFWLGRRDFHKSSNIYWTWPFKSGPRNQDNGTCCLLFLFLDSR